MIDKKYILGIDTSNYKTSMAVASGDEIICDLRKLLKVKEGERGLRQSEALFQHVNNLPEMFRTLRREYDGDIHAVAYSSKPRPVEGSYMPCFLAGQSQAQAIASMLDVPAIELTHQEGHIEAVRKFSGIDPGNEFLACHFSGGTCEVLKAFAGDKHYAIEIVGGTKDISFGQVLDRAGVAMGMEFPCGQELDNIALNAEGQTKKLTPVKVSDGEINLSGFETQIQRKLEETDYEINGDFIREIFLKISDSITKMLIQSCEKTGIQEVIMSGGVSSSTFIRNAVKDKLTSQGVHVYFDDKNLSSDNAVGIAFLGSRYLWD